MISMYSSMSPHDPEFTEVPDVVKQFVVVFYRHIRERNIPEIQHMYEVSFARLSERHYKQLPWPSVELLADLVDEDHVFCLLYKELYFRHLYARTVPDLRQRCESWDNYCALFGVILHGNVNMQLPTIWLWDMIDEFVYQFQSYCQYRGKLQDRPAEELELLKQCEKVWDIDDVLNILQALVDKSLVVEDLLADGGATLHESDGYLPGQSNVLKMLGYFSLVALLRVHTLIGDYHSALKAVYPINVFDRNYLFTPKIVGANITLFYYAGFSYLMMRRYVDAAKCFNTVLVYINRTKSYHQRSSFYEQMLKKMEQLYSLLAITFSLCPSAQKLIDESVLASLKERHGEDGKMAKMSRGEEATFDRLFSYACPRFITAAPPAYPYQSSANLSQEAYSYQLNIFLKDVRTGQELPLLKQYLILYSSISVSKLASLLDMDESNLRTSLLAVKAKSFSMRWDGDLDMTSGALTAANTIDFCIDVDPETEDEMVVISDNVHTKHHADFLALHISKLEGIIRDIESQSTRQVPAA